MKPRHVLVDESHLATLSGNVAQLLRLKAMQASTPIHEVEQY